MSARVLIAGLAVAAFVGGGIVSLADGPLGIAFAGMLLGGAILFVLLLRSLGRWRPSQGHDPEAKQAEARLWSTLNNNRR